MYLPTACLNSPLEYIHCFVRHNLPLYTPVDSGLFVVATLKMRQAIKSGHCTGKMYSAVVNPRHGSEDSESWTNVTTNTEPWHYTYKHWCGRVPNHAESTEHLRLLSTNLPPPKKEKIRPSKK